MGQFEMDLTVAGCEDVGGIESSTWFSAGVPETMGLKEAGMSSPLPGCRTVLLEICGFCGL
jgi:hypothetical protein